GAIGDQTKYDPSTQVAGLLLGNSDVSGIEATVSGAVSNVVAGLHSQLNRLSAAGITFNDDGTLALDGSKLRDARGGQVDGVSFADVKRLFTLGGDSDNNGVRFLLGTDKTAASATPYRVTVSRAAAQATFQADDAVGAQVVIADGTTLTLNVNGRTS